MSLGQRGKKLIGYYQLSDKQCTIQAIVIILLSMSSTLVKKEKDGEYMLITINPRRLNFRKPSPIPFKMLPSLKRVIEDEPINFVRYQRARKVKKLKLIKPQIEPNLFLEGEYLNALHSKPKLQRPKLQSEDNSSLMPFQRKKVSSTYQQLKKEVSPYSVIVKQEESFLHKSESKIKQLSSPMRRKILHSTVQSKPKDESYLRRVGNPNKSEINLKVVEVDRQKQLLYLQKKQLQKIKAESFIVMQYPALRIITGNRFKNSVEIASLTKIMTFYVVMQLAAQYQVDLATEKVTVEETASNMTGTSAQLVVGDKLSVLQLLYGLMLPSGNDAAVTLAIWGGFLAQPEGQNSMQVFIGLMNKYAKDLQLKGSTFANPHGLPNLRNTSTPYDLALLTAQCLKLPLFSKITSTQVFKVWVSNEGGKKELIWQNTNKLLRRQGFIGTKTGVTVTAGPCLASCYQHDDKKFIVIVLRTNKLSRRFKQTRMILGWALKKYDLERYRQAAKAMLKNDAILDSDNSQDEQQFSYDRMDSEEMAKRSKILQFEL